MEQKFNALCQECDFNGLIEGDCCPECESFIYADVSLYEYLRLKEISRKYTNEVLRKDNKVQEYKRRVEYGRDTQTVRVFRCFNIKHYVGAECTTNILDEMLEAVDLLLDLSGDFDEDIYVMIEKAKIKQLARIIPEVIIEVVGTIKDEDIEDLLSNEISEATDWLHEGFEFEEIKGEKS